MESLPLEILWTILSWDVRMCRFEKNTVLALRLVCKAFDQALKPYIFKTVQLDFSRFLRFQHGRKSMDMKSLERVGELAEALYLDMMVVRDEEEVLRLSNVFQGIIPKVPEMVPLLDSIKRHCMNENSFDEMDFRMTLETVLQSTPNICRVKLSLPFQVLGQKSRTATLLFATTLACLSQRPEEHRNLETLVVDHLSDTTLIYICNNHMDVKNAINVFTSLFHLVLSIKRQESQANRQELFSRSLWFLIRKAQNLRSLCLVGWNIKRDINTRTYVHGVSDSVWNMRSLPYSDDNFRWQYLRHLELKRVDISPMSILKMIRHAKNSLQEIYLVEVYLKVRNWQTESNGGLWIGQLGVSKPDSSIWLAQELRDMEGLNLSILRATGLGYDDFEPDPTSLYPGYDLKDPLGLDRSFDQRFVDAVTLGPDALPVPAKAREPCSTVLDASALSKSDSSAGLSCSNLAVWDLNPRKRKDYDAETYQRIRNTTSHYKRCIDGFFVNHNEQALRELQNIITVADRGMTLLSTEMDRARNDDFTLPAT